MNGTALRQRLALCFLLMLLAISLGIGLFGDRFSAIDGHDWIHVLCMTQAVLVAGLVIYGPGRLIVRFPFAVAWAVALGGVLAKENLISIPGSASIEAGIVLTTTGLCSSFMIFALQRYSTRNRVAFPQSLNGKETSKPNQLSLRMIMLFTLGFALAGATGRAIAMTKPDPYGHELQVLFFHAWLGISICLSASLVVLAVFNPRRTMMLFVLFVAIVLIDPVLFPIVANNVLVPQNMFPQDYFMQNWHQSLVWHGQGAAVIGIYAILARAAGLKMIYPAHSIDKKPKPSGDPATEAGCVQD